MKPLKRFLCLLATMLAICPAHCQAMTNYSAAMLNAQEAEMINFVREDRAASENLARSRTVEHAEAAFLSSSSHRITLMGRQWTRMGVGVATTPEGFVYVVQIFVR